MGGLFPADHSGLAGIMFGLAGLVLFGVTITLVMDGQLVTGSHTSAIDTTIAGNDARITGLVKRIDLLEQDHERRAGWTAGLAELEAARSGLTDLESRIDSLREELARERILLVTTTEAFTQYRTDHRNSLWAAAVGTRMAELRLPGGKVYDNVMIRSVSAVAVKIAHASGSATIAVKDLPVGLMEAYLLSAGEARRITEAERKQEKDRLAAARATQENTRPPSRPRTTPPSRTSPETKEQAEARAKKEADVRGLRAEVTQLRSQISALTSQISEARMQAVYGKRRSPPGSLETWSQRLSRLTAQEGQLRARLSVREDELRRLDPTYRPPLPSR